MVDFTEQEIGRYLAGEYKEKESNAFETWINQEPGHRQKYLECKRIWDLSSQVKASQLIDVAQARTRVIRRLHGIGRNKSILTYLTKAAAVLFLPLLLTGLVYVYFTLPSDSEVQEYNSEVNVSFGTVINFILSDGTKVWLNSGSHFKFPAEFTGSSRRVYLEGEAYFEVAGSRKPFIVETSKMEVMAKGTSFNVLAYPDDDRIRTTLVEGKVILSRIIPGSKPVLLAELQPNEMATYYFVDKKELNISATDAQEYISWKEGKLIFNNDSFEEVVRKLSRWYNTDIQLIGPELKTYRYTATFTDETLFQVLELLENSAPIRYTYSERTKNQNGTFTKRKVEIRLRK